MVALDQRESLREMFPAGAGGTLVGDSTLREFKQTAARVLSPYASGVLLDHPLGVQHEWPTHVARGCGLVLAADELQSSRGVGVQGSALDPAVDAELIESTGAAAIKFLVIWRRGDRSYVPVLQSFLELADSAGVPSFVEGIVRPENPSGWASVGDRHQAILEAAADLSQGASVYKAEVPGYLPGDLTAVTEQARQLTAVVGRPWVVLSNGIEQADFAESVALACGGGAHGFLAGRAIWADTVTEHDVAGALAGRSVARLQALTEIVDRARDAGDDPKADAVLEGTLP
jgi:sulfofructosephosphate aldolase